MATERVLINCPFCDVVSGKKPSFKLEETDLSYAFLALPPLTKGHALVVPKVHAAKMHELGDEYLADAIRVAKKIAVEQGLENYNILQNNGRVAYQSVDHVHFHVINKPDAGSGLSVTWPKHKEDLKTYLERVFNEREAKGKTTCPVMRLGNDSESQDYYLSAPN